MQCVDIHESVAGYLDDELSPSAVTQFEAHLDTCEHCGRFVARIGAQDLAPPPPLPQTSQPGFWDAMDARVASELARRPAPPRVRDVVSTRVWMGTAAAMVLAMLWGTHNHHRALQAESTAALLAQELELARDGATVPATPLGPVNGGAYTLATYTPHRDQF